MLRIVFVAFFVSIAANTVAAQDCSTAQEIKKTELTDSYVRIARELRKATARADSQELRINELSQATQASLPSRPAIPELPTDFFDNTGPVIDCDDGFDAAVESLAEDLRNAEIEVSAFAEAIKAWETVVANAEESSVANDDNSDHSSAGATGTADSTGSADATASTDSTGSPDRETVTAQAVNREPLSDPNHPTLFRRVISLPGGTLRPTPTTDADSGDQIPTFSVLYVFDEKSTNGIDWLEVGSSIREGNQGWMRKEDSLDWSTMLVMQFAPRGQRRDVLFFNDSTTLADIVEAPTYSAEATEIYERLANERQQLESDPFYEPKWGSSLVAVEPETAVTYQNEPYILPILDSRDALFDGATDTVLLKVAAVPAGAMDIADRDNASLRGDNLEVRAGEDGEFRIGVVFVMDTTISMAPFIERLHQTVKGFFDAFERYESAAFVSFGLVGFRDDTRPDPERLEYVVEIFQPLDPEADARQVLTNVLQMKEATVPTIGFEEDGLYGIRMAMAEMDWEAFDVRLIVFVTDASSRVGNDPHGATYETPETIAEYGRNNSMVIIPIHLLTPANQSNQDAAKAERQYRTLSETGDLALDKYIALNAESDQEFAQGLNTIADLAARGALNANAGQLISPEEMERSFEGSSSAVQQLGRAVANEIFRAQLESLATVGGGDAPSFLEGWAADRDLTDPDIRTLEVSVFLTRNQLSTLDRRLGLIVDAFRSGGDEPTVFFEKLQVLAAETSTDPDAPPIDDRNVVQTLLPSFLQILPYRSQVLRIDQNYWASISVAQRQEFIEDIEAKRRIYEDIFSQTNLWRDFGSDDPGLSATPVRLTNLP